jgi:hypothetical protein
MRSYLKGNHFQSNEDNHKKTAELRTALSQNDPRGCFKAWMACIHVASEGKYFDAKSMEDTITSFISYSETHTTHQLGHFPTLDIRII